MVVSKSLSNLILSKACRPSDHTAQLKALIDSQPVVLNASIWSLTSAGGGGAAAAVHLTRESQRARTTTVLQSLMYRSTQQEARQHTAQY